MSVNSDAMEEAKDSTKDLLRRSTMEFFGTFFLVLFVGLSSLQQNQNAVLRSVLPGLTLMVLVFVGGHVSLGSFNPAVTLALTLRPGLLSWKALLCYTASELLAGVMAALLAWGLGGAVVPGAPGTCSSNMGLVFVAELLGTFGLAFTVLNAGTSADYEGNSFFGLAIGGWLIVGAIALGPISGAVFNPAVGILSLVAPVHSISVPAVSWVYFIAPYLAAVIAALVFRFVSPRDHAPREALMHGPVINEEHKITVEEGKLKVGTPIAYRKPISSTPDISRKSLINKEDLQF